MLLVIPVCIVIWGTVIAGIYQLVRDYCLRGIDIMDILRPKSPCDKTDGDGLFEMMEMDTLDN